MALPAQRELDPAVFGTPALPTAFGGTPVAAGVPLQARATNGDSYTVFKKVSPFGDNAVVMADGKLEIDATDATATDAAKTNDKVKFNASWKGKAGNT